MPKRDRLKKLELSIAPQLEIVVVFDIDGVLYRQEGEQRQVITRDELAALEAENIVLLVEYVRVGRC